MTKKQITVIKSYLHDNWKYMILYGSVRSGKTYSNNYLFLLELKRVAKLAKERGIVNPKYILAGYSNSSIYNNVISELINTFGIEPKFDRHGHFHLFGVEIIPAYTGSLRGIGAVRGMTAFGAYINEASLATEGVFQEIVQRCSEEGARIIADTNPDVPTHWLKTDYIDNHDPKARIKSFHFTIDDNTFLSKDYVEALKAATPSGMFYDRSILGLWVTGDGVVYKDFDQRTMVIPDSEVPDNLQYYVGVDWGFEHNNAITVLGDDPETGTTYLVENYVDKEKYIDHWVSVAKDIQTRRGRNINFWVDSARPDNLNEFRRARINAKNADKSVMAGIEHVSKMIKQGKFKVAKSASKEFLKEVYQYVWDEKTGAPIKQFDDDMDSIRYAMFNQHKKQQARIIRNTLF